MALFGDVAGARAFLGFSVKVQRSVTRKSAPNSGRDWGPLLGRCQAGSERLPLKWEPPPNDQPGVYESFQICQGHEAKCLQYASMSFC